MHGPLTLLYHPSASPETTASPLHLLALPLYDGPISDLHLNLISTYLLHTILVLTQTTTDIPALTDALHDASSPTLLSWAPTFSQLPEKQQDHLYTRAYTVTSRLASSNVPATCAYSLRAYSLLCLAHTRPSVVPPHTYWEQAVKFAGVFAGTDSVPPQEGAKSVCDSYARLVDCVERRPDRTEFMAGPAFARFCEYWSRFAKQVR